MTSERSRRVKISHIRVTAKTTVHPPFLLRSRTSRSHKATREKEADASFFVVRGKTPTTCQRSINTTTVRAWISSVRF